MARFLPNRVNFLNFIRNQAILLPPGLPDFLSQPLTPPQPFTMLQNCNSKLTFVLKGRVPSLKNCRQLVRRGQRTISLPSAAHRAWHPIALQQLKSQILLLPPEIQNQLPLDSVRFCDIGLFTEDKRRFDLDNALSSILDVLVDAKILVTDDYITLSNLKIEFLGVQRNAATSIITLFL